MSMTMLDFIVAAAEAVERMEAAGGYDNLE